MKVVRANNGAVYEEIVAARKEGEVTSVKDVKAGEVDAAVEKHVPVIEQDEDTLTVKVGGIAHPMTEEHYINAIWIEFEDGTSMKAGLTPASKPEATFNITGKSGKVVAYEYCNLHGLWKAEFTIKD